MHPILLRKGGLAIYLATWIPIAALLAILLARSGELGWVEAFLIAAPLALVHAFICLAAWYLCRAMPLGASPLPGLLASAVAAAAISSSLWLFLGRGWLFILVQVIPIGGGAERYTRQMPLLFAVGTLLFLLAVAVNYLLIAFEDSRAAETRALELKVMATEAELRALRAQIDPHFLFNSLHSISALTATDPAGARRMALLLADFLRDSLALGRRERITLAEELSLADHYLSVEKVRFGSRLRLEKDLSPGAGECLVPPLLLQPLVENAVTHGIAHLLNGGVIQIEARRRGSRLEVSVENPCDPEVGRRRGAGVGLENVKLRVQTLFGQEGRLDVADKTDRFRVELTLPASFEPVAASTRAAG